MVALLQTSPRKPHTCHMPLPSDPSYNMKQKLKEREKQKKSREVMRENANK